MSYDSLSKIFYKNASSNRFAENEELARMRREAESSFDLGLCIGSEPLFLANPPELSLACERVLRKEWEVAFSYAALPLVARRGLTRNLIIDEVVCTNELEGVSSTRAQVSDALESSPHKGADRRFRELALLYLGLSDKSAGLPETSEDVRGIYDKVMSGEELGASAPDGRLFRAHGVEIVGDGGRILHEGIEGEESIEEAVLQMLRIACCPVLPQLYGAFASHFMFEFIHPFYDGNGRTGRYLLSLYLSRVLSLETSLSLSRAISARKGAYFRAFKEVEHPLNHGEVTGFVLCLLDYVAEAQGLLVDEAQEAAYRLEAIEEWLSVKGRESKMPPRDIEALRLVAQHEACDAYPRVSLDEVEGMVGASRQTARACLTRLEKAGYVTYVSRRPLAFRLSKKSRGELGL